MVAIAVPLVLVLKQQKIMIFVGLFNSWFMH